jgi:hypothetical protein
LPGLHLKEANKDVSFINPLKAPEKKIQCEESESKMIAVKKRTGTIPNTPRDDESPVMKKRT